MAEKRKKFSKEEENTFDIMPFLVALKKKIGIIILVAVLAGAISFAYTYIFVTPMYQTNFTVYVNNRSNKSTEKTDSLSSQDVNAAKSLASTYAQIICGRNVLEKAAAKCGMTEQKTGLEKLVNVSTSEETEIITVEVLADSPELAYDFAKAIIEVAQTQISSIVDGSSMAIVDQPFVPSSKHSPSYPKNIIIGALIGAFVVVLIIFIREITNDVIKDEKALEERTGYVVLGSIPNYNYAKQSDYGYASSNQKRHERRK